MDSNGVKMEKQPSVMSINGDVLNTASTLKLTENDTCQNKNGAKEGFAMSDSEMYLPFDHRDKTNATPDYGALVHMLKSSLGSGILAMPSAFKNGGLVFGIVGTVLVGFICTHCVHLLVYCSQFLSARVKKPSLSFAETAEAAFKTGPEKLRKLAPFAREFVNIALFATYYLGNTVYVVFISNSLKQVLDNHFHTDLDVRLCILLVAIPLIPIGAVRSLRYLIPFSGVATVLIIVGLAMTLYFTFIDLPSIETRAYIAPVAHIPLFFSTVLFAMEGIGTVLPIENSMKNPNHFLGCPGVLNTAMTVVVVLYGVVGFCGYLKFGEDTLGSITLNLGENWISETVKIIVALSILFTYGLQFTVPTEIIWKRLSKRIDEKKHNLGYYIMRVLMIIGTVIIAIIVPQLSPFISLVGAICFSILGLLCPALIEMAALYEEGYGVMKWRLVKDIIIAVLAIIALVSGTYASLLEIIEIYKPKH